MYGMDFIGLPPEVTSALIHSGPGAEPLVEAAHAWQRLGYDLEESIRAYSPVLASVAEAWHGPASTAMIQAVGTYLTWMGSTAQQCLVLGSSAQAAAGAFGSVLAAVVHPSVVSANRIQLTQLLATNGLGKNVAAIAETEAQYERMWVNNATAMYRYQAASAQALQLPMFTSPPSIATPDGPAAQAEAVQTASASTTSTGVTSALANAAAAVAPADAVAPPVSPLDALLQAIGVTFDPNQGWFALANTWGNQFISSGFPINMLSYFAQTSSAQALQSVAPDIAEGLSEGESALGAGSLYERDQRARRRRTGCSDGRGRLDGQSLRAAGCHRGADRGPPAGATRCRGVTAACRRCGGRVPDAAAVDGAADLGG